MDHKVTGQPSPVLDPVCLLLYTLSPGLCKAGLPGGAKNLVTLWPFIIHIFFKLMRHLISMISIWLTFIRFSFVEISDLAFSFHRKAVSNPDAQDGLIFYRSFEPQPARSRSLPVEHTYPDFTLSRGGDSSASYFLFHCSMMDGRASNTETPLIS